MSIGPAGQPIRQNRLADEIRIDGLSTNYGAALGQCLEEIDLSYRVALENLSARSGAGGDFLPKARSHYERHLDVPRAMPEAVRAFGLSPDEAAATVIACFASGLGLVEQYRAVASGTAQMTDGSFPNPYADGKGRVRDHCVRTRVALEGMAAISLLSPEHREAVLEAVMFKGSRSNEIALLEGSLAFKICYAIRDNDKLAMLVLDKDRDYLSPNGVATCFIRYFAKDWIGNFDSIKQVADSPDGMEAATDIAARSLKNNALMCFPGHQRSLPKPGIVADQKYPLVALTQAMRGFMERVPHEETVRAVANGENMGLDRISQSHADYLLFQISTVYDARSPNCLETVLKAGGISDRMAQIRARTRDDDFARIKKGIESFFASRLPTFDRANLSSYLSKDA